MWSTTLHGVLYYIYWGIRDDGGSVQPLLLKHNPPSPKVSAPVPVPHPHLASTPGPCLALAYHVLIDHLSSAASHNLHTQATVTA